MSREEFEQLITEIGTCEDTAQIRAMLGDLKEKMNAQYDSFDSVSQERDSLKTENEDIRKANMKLFLQVGNKEKPEPKDPEPKGDGELKYEDLFDDKGGLK